MKIMNIHTAKKWMAGALAVLTTTMVFGDVTTPPAAAANSAGQPAMAAKPERSYTGLVVSLDPKERAVSVKSWPFPKKTFNLGDNCTYALSYTTLENKAGTANDLRAGEKVTVRYQDSHGVLIADRIEQRALQSRGLVAAINPDQHTLTLRRSGLEKQLVLPTNCIVLLRGEKAGTLADIHAGDHVTVMYELPDRTPTAREIAQTSLAFTGTLTAIDLGDKTVKARAPFETKKFNVADNCAVVINGKPDGKLSDLKPDEKLVFSYDEINGINVVNRIGPAPVETQSKANQMSTGPGYPGYPLGY
jgi:hypothetical protein